MSKYLTLCVAGFVGLVVVIFLFGLFSFRSNVITLDKRFEAQYLSNQSSYDSMWKKFKENAQVTDLQAEQYKSVYLEMISGRYQGDQNTLFKMVKEDNPKLNDVYTILQQQISSDRNEFNNSQRKLLDIGREYNSYIEIHFIYNSIFNFKSKNNKDFIVTSDQTDKAFTEKKAEEFKLK